MREQDLRSDGVFFFFSSRRRHTRLQGDWSSDVCSSDLGGADAVARIVADKVGKILGQPLLVDNRPGAGTTLASEHVARAAPDGYTLLLEIGRASCRERV